MGKILLQVFIVEYFVIALVFLWQRDYARMLYFISAAGISIAVLIME